MKSIISIGSPALFFANYLADYPEYNMYSFDHTKAEFKIPVFTEVERYEEPLAGLEEYLATVADEVIFVVSGGEFCSLISLQVLEKIKEKKVEIIYLQPDLDLLNKTCRQIHNLVHGVLQEMTRSHVFERFYLFELDLVRKTTESALISDITQKVSAACARHFHTFNWLTSQQEVFGFSAENIKNAKISSLSYCDFNLTNMTNLGIIRFIRQQEVFYGISEKKIKNDTSLYDKITESFRSFRNDEINNSFKVFSVPFDQDVVYIKNSTTAVQNKFLEETLDKQGKA